MIGQRLSNHSCLVNKKGNHGRQNPKPPESARLSDGFGAKWNSPPRYGGYCTLSKTVI